MKLSLQIFNPDRGVLDIASWEDEVFLVYRSEYCSGDRMLEQGTLHFFDGSDMVTKPVKPHDGQKFTFPKKKIEWLVLDCLIKADEPSPFPALTQMEVLGRESRKAGCLIC